MRTSTRRTIVVRDAVADLLRRGKAISEALAVVVGHAIVGTVEGQASNTRVALDAGSLLETRSHVLGDLAEDGDLALDDLLLRAVAHVARDVVDEALLGAFVEDLLPQGAGGLEVFGTDLGEEGDGLADEVAVRLVEVDGALAEGDWLDGAQVRWARALVVEGHVAVTLEVGHPVWHAGCVDWQLLVVDTDTVAVGVWVGEQTGLEDRVCRRLNAWRQVRRVEGDLLDLGEVVLYVLVQVELANLAERELVVRPDVGQVEDVDALVLPELLGLLGGHGLPADVPAWVVALLNGVVKVLLSVVWGVVRRVFLSDEACALLALHVHLAIDPIAVLVDELLGVSSVSVHFSPAVRDAAVTHQDHDLVDRLWVL